jgi:heat-inducible transcriptional repressor
LTGFLAEEPVLTSQTKQARALEVLTQVVELHGDSGAPVGSKAVAAALGSTHSPATVRAVMAELTEQGILEQPHTSSGRVPTDRGYRLYLDHVQPVGPSPTDRAEVEALGWSRAERVHDLLQEAAGLLVYQMGSLGLVMAPRLDDEVLSHLSFVLLRPGTALAIVVTRAGVLRERRLDVDPGLEANHLLHFGNYLNGFLPGRTIREVASRIALEQVRDKAELSALESQALALGRRALAGETAPQLLVEGAEVVLRHTEFAVPGRAAELLRAIARRDLWISLLEQTVVTEDIHVYIGEEVGSKALEPCAVITAPYQSACGDGALALVGPKRLDYRRAIALCSLVAERLTMLLSTGA